MTHATIYHNPRCSKSRQTLDLLNDNKIDTLIIEYLKNPLDKNQIKIILSTLNCTAIEIIRKNEKIFSELNLSNINISENKLIDAIVHHPILLERPIVIYKDKARICRPPELVLELIK
jgi:arsenate reductase